MASDAQRLFVGNLPPDILENDLQKEFSCYGPVQKVEVKHKKRPDSEIIDSTFAFITMVIDERMLRQCLQEFKAEQYRGRYLQVTVARENFLEKLKREREEAAEIAARKAEASVSKKEETVKGVLPTISTGQSSSSSESSSEESSEEEERAKPVQTKQNGVKKSKKSSSSDSSSESEEDEENLVLRKKSKIFLENGKIKIDRNVSAGEAIHVIDKTNKTAAKKELDEKSKKADQKRIESLKKMKNSYNEQKLAIKNALAGVDTSKKNNKIVFDDDEDDSKPAKPSQKVTTSTKPEKSKAPAKKPTLFEDEDDDNDNVDDYKKDFQIKEQFQGRQGERLMKLQSRFQTDSRFKMDARFMEEADDEEENGNGTEYSNNHKTAENEEDDERQWQYNILESVIGKKVRNDTPKELKKKTPPSMLRFDPTRAEHTKFVEPKGKKRANNKTGDEPSSKRSKLPDLIDEEEEKVDEVPVSMEQFYEVRGDLKKSLGSGGFSLLSMFNRASEGENTSAVAAPYEEKIIAKNSSKFLADLDPFKYDSSGDEADDSKKKTEKSSATSARESELQHETFFMISSTDARMSEGLGFFTPATENGDENPDNNYDDAQRQELKNIVKRKIKKSVQNALPRHAKPNKRFRRFTKNL